MYFMIIISVPVVFSCYCSYVARCRYTFTYLLLANIGDIWFFSIVCVLSRKHKWRQNKFTSGLLLQTKHSSLCISFHFNLFRNLTFASYRPNHVTCLILYSDSIICYVVREAVMVFLWIDRMISNRKPLRFLLLYSFHFHH